MHGPVSEHIRFKEQIFLRLLCKKLTKRPGDQTFMSRLLRSSRDHFLTNKWNKVKQYKVTSQISITHLSLILCHTACRLHTVEPSLWTPYSLCIQSVLGNMALEHRGMIWNTVYLPTGYDCIISVLEWYMRVSEHKVSLRYGSSDYQLSPAELEQICSLRNWNKFDHCGFGTIWGNSRDWLLYPG